MGDFNVPDINQATLSGSFIFSNQLCDLVFQFNLSQLVDQPSHIYGNILDIIFYQESAISTVHPTHLAFHLIIIQMPSHTLQFLSYHQQHRKIMYLIILKVD